VHAGTPQNPDNYLEVDLTGAPFYVHKDLIDWKLEVYWIGTDSVEKLAVRNY
jgi:hypothetical protein